MDAITTKKRRALSDVSNKKDSTISAKKKFLGPSGIPVKVDLKASKPLATRKSTRVVKKASSIDKLLNPIERLTVSQTESKKTSNRSVTENDIEIDEVHRALNWVNVDANTTCTYFIPEYVNDIFQYYKEREPLFKVPDYLASGSREVSLEMRAVLVDWLVDVQQSFELNHESLYSAVKAFDLYMSRMSVSKHKVQLVGAAALNISCKYDERIPPALDDFVYVCDDAYNRNEFIEMEISILKELNFDFGFPLSYTFLRRYSQCARSTTLTLTLARYILEISLMYFEFVVESESQMACAALYMAMAMRGEGSWDDTMVHYTGHGPRDFRRIVVSLNNVLDGPPIADTKAIKAKYSHRVFQEVAKIPLLPTQALTDLIDGRGSD